MRPFGLFRIGVTSVLILTLNYLAMIICIYPGTEKKIRIMI